MSTTIRKERPDTEAASRLIEELDAILSPLYPDESRHGYSIDKLIAQKVEFFVLYHNGDPVGCAGVQFFPEQEAAGEDHGKYGEVKRMYVRDRFRGLGFAKRLLKHLEEQTVAQGIALLRLETGIHQPEAVKLYEKSGFYGIGPFGEYREDPPSLYFEKRIALPAIKKETAHD